MHPILTIFCAFTREWAVDGWLENLIDVEHDPALVNLCFIVDGDHAIIENKLKRFNAQRKYRSFHVKTNERWHANEMNLKIRRQRVADIHNQSKDLINATDGDIVIGLEDDTVFDRMTSFAQLYSPLLEREQVGFVEGVQMGRWGAKIIGAWRQTSDTSIQTALPRTGIEDITAGGFYGYATRRHLYLNHDYYSSTSQPWGPDVNYGMWVIKQGYRCLVNWDLIFGHWDYNTIAYPDDPKYNLCSVVFEKNLNTGKWDRTDHEQSRY